jgi:lipopolysaccharide biosynthesis glycosyltransferase
LQDKIFGAVIDFAEVFSCEWSGVPNYRELGFAPDTKYFNSGLMVIDLDKWRNEHVTHRVIQCMHENLDHVNLADQYGLNVVLAKDWLELDRRWNNYSIVDRKDPFIIHFLDIKPIYRSYKLSRDYQAEFYKYLRMTSWKNHRPQSDYWRIVRKIYNKSKKILSKIRIRSRNIKVS